MTTTNPVSHIKITQAGLIALLATIVGQLVAFIPNLAGDQQILISAGSAAIGAVFMIANAIHALATSKLSVKVIEQDVPGQVKAELARILQSGIAQSPPPGTINPAAAATLSPVAASPVAS
jgi:hypothetical protein